MRWLAPTAVVIVAAVVWWLSGDSDPTRRSEPTRTAGDPIRKPASEPDPEPTPETEAPDPTGVLFSGRAVDAEQRPIADAGVLLGIDGFESVLARSGVDGRFAVRGGKAPAIGYTPVRVELTMADTGAIHHTNLMPASPDEIDVGDIVLRGVHQLTVHVRHAGAPVPGARVVSVKAWSPTGVVRTGPAGDAVIRLLSPGEHEVRVACEGYARAETTVKIPDAKDVTVNLGTERAVAVTVVDAGSGKPVQGATFDVNEWRKTSRGASIQRLSPPLLIPPTDADGRTRIRGLRDESVLLLAVRAAGYPAPRLRFGSAGKTRLKAHVTELLVRLDPPRTIRWPVVEGPPDGAKVTVRAMPGSYLKEVPSDGVMQGRHLVVDGWGPGSAHGIAVAPDGSLASLWCVGDTDTGRETTFRAPRHIAIHVHAPDGTPVERIPFALRNQGNNPMAPTALSDAAGRVRFESLHGQRADVYMLPHAAVSWGGHRVGTVDLDKGSGEIDVVLQPEVDLVVKVRVDGKAALPSKYTLLWRNMPLPNVVADRTKGELRTRLRPLRANGSIHLELSAEGFQRARGSTATGEITFDLKPAGVWEITVIPPADKRFALMLQKWIEKPRVWQWTQSPQVPFDGGIRFGPLAAGRYRAFDRASGATSEPVEIVAGAAAAVATLDLSRVGWVSGRVELPEGTAARTVRVLVGGADPTTMFDQRDIRVGRDGSFSVRVPGDRKLTLSANHPLLVTVNEVSVTSARDDVVLRLEPGATATVRLDREPKPKLSRGRGPPANVQLFAGPVTGRPVRKVACVVDKDTFTFGGFVPGTYTVWIDVAPFAPITLGNVVLKAGANDLGMLTTSFGSSLRMKILVKEGDPPRVGLFASSVTGPTYHRGLNSGGEAEVVLRGLGAGTFSVNGGPIMSRGKVRLNETVELDGSSDHALTLDLR